MVPATDGAELAWQPGAIPAAFLLTASALIAGVAAISGVMRGGRHRDEGRIFGGLACRAAPAGNIPRRRRFAAPEQEATITNHDDPVKTFWNRLGDVNSG